MKIFLKSFLFLLIALSCSKDDDDPVNNGSVRIIINNYPDDADTISIRLQSVLNVRITGSQFPKYVMKVFTRQMIQLTDSSYDGTFSIPAEKLFIFTGFYDTRFEFYGGQSSQTFIQISNSGIYINKRLVVIDFSGYDDIPEPTFFEKNGTLQGTFDTTLRIQALTISKFYQGLNSEVRIDSVMATGDGEFVFTDNSYVGERTYYAMKGYSLNDSGALVYSGAGAGNKPLEIVPHEVFSDENGLPVIRWNKNRYYQNFGSYRIRKPKGSGINPLLKEITDINDTVESGLDLGFPGAADISVTHLPKENLQNISPDVEIQDFGNLMKYKPGNPFPPYDEFTSPRGNNIYTFRNYDKYLYRFSSLTLHKEDSIECPSGRFCVSPNNKYLLTIFNDHFNLYDLVSGQEVSVLISKYLPAGSVNDFAVSDIGTMIVVNGFEDLKLIDVIHDQLLGTFTFTNGTLNLCKISSTGEYMYLFTEYKHRIYRFSGGSFTEVFNLIETGFWSLSFIPDQPEKILLSLADGMKIYNLFTGITELHDPSFPQFPDYHVDFNDYLVLTEDDNFIKIYDISTGAIVSSVVHNIDYADPHDDYLHGHTLFNGNGTWMRLK